VLLLLLVAGAVLWVRRFLAARERQRAEQEATLAALAGVHHLDPRDHPDHLDLPDHSDHVDHPMPVTAPDDRG